MQITYEFFFDNDRIEMFEMNFTRVDFSLEPFPLDNVETWVLLESYQCKVCTLNPSEHTYCPVARNLSYVLIHFTNDRSHEKVLVRVTADGRVTEKFTPLQEGVSPLWVL